MGIKVGWVGSKVGWVAQPVRVAYALTSGGGWSKLNPNFLAVILIYSLMVSDVEEKTYEFGMLRMLGLEKQSLIFLMISEGLLFGILGLSIGILFAYLLNTLVGTYSLFRRKLCPFMILMVALLLSG